MSVGQRLKEARKAANMTQVTLAQVSGVQQARITALETGVQEKSVFLPKLALALGADVSWLATGITQEERAIELTAVEQEILELLRKLSPEEHAREIAYMQKLVAQKSSLI